ncbi:MAG: hypothetical protein ABNH38_20240 [Tateyamaria sp.]|jgi:hypothetical protein|uniref:hypothetical protein n=1 Tax=Tateyamaria sp. TaxID=1929288 RepID=UPI0032DCD7BB
MEEARKALAQYRALEPDRTIKVWQATNNYANSEGGKRYSEGLRLTGLPEE